MKKPVLFVIVVVVSSFILGLFAATFSSNWKGHPGTIHFAVAGPMAGEDPPVISVVCHGSP